jgi:hypothetical protein
MANVYKKVMHVKCLQSALKVGITIFEMPTFLLQTQSYGWNYYM